jgi:hypothetical protein
VPFLSMERNAHYSKQISLHVMEEVPCKLSSSHHKAWVVGIWGNLSIVEAIIRNFTNDMNGSSGKTSLSALSVSMITPKE